MGLLTASDRRTLCRLLLQLPFVEDHQARLALLADLPLQVLGRVPDSPTPWIHFTHMIRALDGTIDRDNGRLADGSWPILSLLEQALIAAAGQPVEASLRELYALAGARAGQAVWPEPAQEARVEPIAPLGLGPAGDPEPVTLIIALRQLEHSVSATLTLSRTAVGLIRELVRTVVSLDQSALLACADPDQYGAVLTNMLFAAPDLLSSWLQAQAYADGVGSPLRVRLALPPEDRALLAFHWETLCDPQSGVPLALDERACLARMVQTKHLRAWQTPLRTGLRAAVFVAAPDNCADFGLEAIDAAAELGRARAIFGKQLTAVVARAGEAPQPATLPNLRAALRMAPQILYLLCHSKARDGHVYLCLENAAGKVAWVAGEQLVTYLSGLAEPPMLVVLGTCFSAGADSDSTLALLGSQLAAAGATAVIGFRDRVAPKAVASLLQSLIEELQKDGRVDKALTIARATLPSTARCQPALWLVTTDGRLWREP